MPIFRQLTEEELAMLNSKNSSIVKQLTPLEKLEKILLALKKRNVKVRKFHFHCLETENKLFLFNGDRQLLATFADTTVKGQREARIFAIGVFTGAGLKRENRDGGYMFDFWLKKESEE